MRPLQILLTLLGFYFIFAGKIIDLLIILLIWLLVLLTSSFFQ